MGSLSNLYISQSYQSLIHLGTNNTASATLIGLEDGLGNSIGVSVNTAGNLFLSGTFSASLQEGYLYVGNSSGRTIAFPTSSLVTNINTGSLVTTSSFNAYTASTNIRLSNIELTTASVLISINNINTFTSSANISINALNVFTASQSTASLVTSITNLNQFTQSQQSFNNSATASIVALQNFSSSLDTNFVTEAELAAATGSLITQINTKLNTSSFNSYTSSNNQRVSSLESNSASVNTSITNINSFTQSANIRLNNLETTSASVNVSIANINSTTASQATSISNLNSFTQSQAAVNVLLAGEIDILEAKTGSYATTGSNTFIGNQTITGNISAFSASFTYLQTIFESSSIIYSSGSNQFGDELTDIQTLSGSVKVQGSLTINGVPVQTSSFDPSALNQATASLQAFTQSANIRLNNLESTSASVNVSITNINSFTSSQQSFNASATASIVELLNLSSSLSGGFVTEGELAAATASLITQINTKLNTSSFNSYTQSNDQRVSSLESNSASVNISITNLNASSASQQISIDALNVFTASQSTASIVTSINNLNSFTQSADIRLTNIENTTASLNTSITNINTFSASALVSINNLNSATASYVTETESGSFLITASFDNGTRNLTFTKGNTTTFAVNIPDASGSAGDFVTTSSFNAYTSSNDQRVSSLQVNSASVNTSITNINSTTASLNTSVSNLNGFSASALISINALNSATSSYITESESGSFLITGSVAGNVLTFTKGDNTTFNLTVATGSGGGGSTNTGSLLVTASVNVNVITFTKGDASTFDLTVAASGSAPAGTVSSSAQILNYGIFATTGSNTFRGNQSLISSSIDLQGSGKITMASGMEIFGNAGDISSLAAPTTIQFITEPPAGPGGTNDIKFINRVSGSEIVFQNSQTGAGNSVNFEAGAVSFNIGARSGSTGKVVFGSNTVSIEASSTPITASAFKAGPGGINSAGALTASLQQGFTYVGNASGVTTLVATSSFTGSGGGGQTFANPSIESISGSVLITANGFTSGAANLTHISASAQNQANILFKNTNTAASTIVSGSFNLYTNPAAPTAGRLNYLENSNIFLNDSGFLPTVTASVLAAGGFYPRLRNNLWLGTGPWTINTNRFATSSTLAGSFNNNLFLGATGTTINTLGNTVGPTFSHNIMSNAAAIINAPSRSIAEINAGQSGSNTVSFIGNASFGGTTQYNGPVSSSTHNISGNNTQGTFALNLQSGSRGYTITSNITNGTLTINDNTVFAPTLGSTNIFSQNNINGTITLTNRASASISITGNTLSGFTITNDFDASTNGTNGRTFVLQGNVIAGFVGNNIYFSGSAAGANSANERGRGLYGNLINGSRISASVTGDGNRSLIASAIVGHGLNIYGTSLYDASNAANAGGQNGGSAFFGRWNAEDGNRALSAQTVFAVGTGNSGSAGITRKTGFLIDSGSNTFIEGTLNVSGSTTITGSLILSSSAATELIVIGESQFSGSVKVAPTFQLQLPTGSNQQAGTAVLDGGNPGTVTVSNSLVTANSIIMLTKQTLTNAHMVAITAKSAGSFTITSNGNGDTDTVGWFVINNS